jgi:hypothetical protein
MVNPRPQRGTLATPVWEAYVGASSMPRRCRVVRPRGRTRRWLDPERVCPAARTPVRNTPARVCYDHVMGRPTSPLLQYSDLRTSWGDSRPTF